MRQDGWEARVRRAAEPSPTAPVPPAVVNRNGAGPGEEDQTRVNICDEEDMPEAELGKLVVAKPLRRHIHWRIALLDHGGDAARSDGIHLFFHETSYGI